MLKPSTRNEIEAKEWRLYWALTISLAFIALVAGFLIGRIEGQLDQTCLGTAIQTDTSTTVVVGEGTCE